MWRYLKALRTLTVHHSACRLDVDQVCGRRRTLVADLEWLELSALEFELEARQAQTVGALETDVLRQARAGDNNDLVGILSDILT